MTLSTQDRGAIEKLIESAVRAMPKFVRLYRNKLPGELGVKNFEDYAMGYAHGFIAAGFRASYFAIHNESPGGENTLEAEKIILKRSGELKEGYFKAG
jgi:hypothetical protein